MPTVLFGQCTPTIVLNLIHLLLIDLYYLHQMGDIWPNQRIEVDLQDIGKSPHHFNYIADPQPGQDATFKEANDDPFGEY